MNSPLFDPIRKGTSGINQITGDHLLQPGDRVGHSRVIELIAAGGMANVYKVWQEQLEVVRAIKILKPGYTEESKSRLETEAKISANLRHPNIVEIYGMGYWNTIPYIEMEYIDGPSLKELLESNVRLSIPSGLAISHFLCIALQFAYNQDMTLYGKVYDHLIHRDLKPANILISSKGVVKLADFGIARPSEVSIHTVGSKVMGTFAYLSPEQLNGEKLDQRSDIYALGTVLYETISGVKAFPQRLLADLVQKKTKGYYTPIGCMGITIPRHLIDIIEKSLHLDKNKRYSDITDLDNDILSALSRLTPKTPEEILQSITGESADNSIKIHKKKHTGTRAVIITLMGIILTGTISLIALKKIEQRSLSTAAVELPTIQLSSQESQPADTTPVKLPQKIPRAPSPTSYVQKHVNVSSPLEKGISAFKSGQYNEAITLLTPELSNNTDKSIVTTIRLYLIESHINLHLYERALSIAKQEIVELPEYYLFMGKLSHYFQENDRAVAAINKALSFNNIEHQTLSQLRLLKIRISEENYNLKPNADNMRKVHNDITLFIECCCSDVATSSPCQESQIKLQRFSQ